MFIFYINCPLVLTPMVDLWTAKRSSSSKISMTKTIYMGQLIHRINIYDHSVCVTGVTSTDLIIIHVQRSF